MTFGRFCRKLCYRFYVPIHFKSYNCLRSFFKPTKDSVLTPVLRIDLTAKSPTVMFIKLFNKLPTHIKSITSIKQFKYSAYVC